MGQHDEFGDTNMHFAAPRPKDACAQRRRPDTLTSPAASVGARASKKAAAVAAALRHGRGSRPAAHIFFDFLPCFFIDIFFLAPQAPSPTMVAPSFIAKQALA